MLQTFRSEYQCCSDAEAKKCCGVPVELSLELGTSAGEISDTKLRHMNSDSAITLRGASGGDALVATDLHSFQLAGMNLLRMVPAGSGCCPSIETTVFAGDAHAPFGIDQINITPADRDFLNGVNNGQGFFGKNYFGSDENQVSTVDDSNGPSNCFSQSVGRSSRPDKTSAEHNDASAQDKTTLGSKDFALMHTSIFPHFSLTSLATDGQDK